MVVAHRTVPLLAKETVSELGVSYLTEQCRPGAWDGEAEWRCPFYTWCMWYSQALWFVSLCYSSFFSFIFLQKFLNWTSEFSQSSFQLWISYLVLCWGMEAGVSYSAELVKSLPQLFKEDIQKYFVQHFFLSQRNSSNNLVCHYYLIETKVLCMFSNYPLVTRLNFGSKVCPYMFFTNPKSLFLKPLKSKFFRAKSRQAVQSLLLFIHLHREGDEYNSRDLIYLTSSDPGQRVGGRRGSALTWVVRLDVRS